MAAQANQTTGLEVEVVEPQRLVRLGRVDRQGHPRLAVTAGTVCPQALLVQAFLALAGAAEEQTTLEQLLLERAGLVAAGTEEKEPLGRQEQQTREAVEETMRLAALALSFLNIQTRSPFLTLAAG